MIRDNRPGGGSFVPRPYGGACPLVLIISRPPAGLRIEPGTSLLRALAAGLSLENRLDYDGFGSIPGVSARRITLESAGQCKGR